jgi:hypothetical protein
MHESVASARARLKMLCTWLIALALTVPAGRLSAQPPSAADVRDEQLRRLAIGTWQDEYQGKRTKTLNEDGTGTMLVELDGLRARLFAPRLTFQMVWSIEDGRLKKRTVKGEPAMQVQLILKTMGDRVDERILELTEDRLLLLDKDGKTRYDWKREKPAPSDKDS